MLEHEVIEVVQLQVMTRFRKGSGELLFIWTRWEKRSR